jgi:glycosyltransferase involved in cell wall biosynthesis
MTSSIKKRISIITATYNAAAFLPRLIESLIRQTDQDFEWIVTDGGSTDGTIELVEKSKLILKNVVIHNQYDFGIYDALNRGIKISTSDFYVVLGADDELLPNGVHTFKIERDGEAADLITFNYYIGSRISKIKKNNLSFLYSQFSYVTGHAVGLLIKKELHNTVGYYSNKFPIAADQLFILNSIRIGAKIKKCSVIVGRFSTEGLSHNDAAGSSTEIFRVNLLLGQNFYIQLLILILRLIKHRSKIIKFKLKS